MFTITLTEFVQTHEASDYAGIERSFDNGTLKTGEQFTHFQHNFRTLPADKIARIMTILNEPPAPQRKTRSDAGKPKTNK